MFVDPTHGAGSGKVRSPHDLIVYLRDLPDLLKKGECIAPHLFDTNVHPLLSVPFCGTFEDECLNDYTDEQLLQYLRQSPSLITTRSEIVTILSQTLVAKPIPSFIDPSDELSALELGRTLGISVPVVRRVVRSTDNPMEKQHFIIMDRIHGLTLEQLWPHLSLWSTFRVAWQLRYFLHTMSSVTSLTTGGLSTGIANSEWLQDVHGPIPHASPLDFSNYLNWWLLKCRPGICESRPDLVVNPNEHVFVHQDLAPRNMILDGNGKLWIVDWDHAGYYPAYMEYMGLRTTAMPWIHATTWGAWWARLRWSFFRWIAAGPLGRYKKGHDALHVVYSRSIKFRADRTPYSRPSRRA